MLSCTSPIVLARSKGVTVSDLYLEYSMAFGIPQAVSSVKVYFVCPLPMGGHEKGSENFLLTTYSNVLIFPEYYRKRATERKASARKSRSSVLMEALSPMCSENRSVENPHSLLLAARQPRGTKKLRYILAHANSSLPAAWAVPGAALLASRTTVRRDQWRGHRCNGRGNPQRAGDGHQQRARHGLQTATTIVPANTPRPRWQAGTYNAADSQQPRIRKVPG